jgi:hypothetical protein
MEDAVSVKEDGRIDVAEVMGRIRERIRGKRERGLYTDHVLNRQAQLNLYMVYLCHNLVRELVRLQLDHTALRNRCDRLEADLQEARRLRGPGPPAGA